MGNPEPFNQGLWECLLVTHSECDLSHNCSILFLAEAFPKSSKKVFSSSNWAHLRDIDPQTSVLVVFHPYPTHIKILSRLSNHSRFQLFLALLLTAKKCTFFTYGPVFYYSKTCLFFIIFWVRKNAKMSFAKLTCLKFLYIICIPCQITKSDSEVRNWLCGPIYEE